MSDINSNINVYLLDNSNFVKEEINIIKPKSYHELSNQIKQKLKNIPENYETFILYKNNEIKINNEENYNIIDDIIFLREIDKNVLEQSLFDINYNLLSESNQQKLDEKYDCILCSIIIKNENPYLCYKCQNIFHEKCLKDWDNKCKLQNKNLFCPNCRNELSIENWNKKLDHENSRKDSSILINKINELKLNNEIKNEKIKELKNNNLIQFEMIKKYEKYFKKTSKIFKDILTKINSMYESFELKTNQKLEDLINEYQLLNTEIINININIEDIFKVIDEELDNLKNYIINNKIDRDGINLDKNINKENDFMIKNKNLNKDNAIIKNDFNRLSQNIRYDMKINNEFDNNNILENKSKDPNNIYFDIENIFKNKKIENVDFKNGVNNNLENEDLIMTSDGHFIFGNGLLKGIIHKYSEISDVVDKIQKIFFKNISFNLVYKAFNDGDKAQTFHEKCDNLGMSLVLIETDKNIRFGGFTMKSWEGSCVKKKDNLAFVFSLETNNIFDIIINEPAIGCYPKFGPVFFGCQIRIYDNFFSRGGTTCPKGLNYYTTIDYELNNGERNFLVKDIEIYGLNFK